MRLCIRIRSCTLLAFIIAIIILFTSCVSTQNAKVNEVFTIQGNDAESDVENTEGELHLPTVYLDVTSEVLTVGISSGRLTYTMQDERVEIPALTQADIMVAEEQGLYEEHADANNLSVVLDMPPVMFPEFAQIYSNENNLRVDSASLYALENIENTVPVAVPPTPPASKRTTKAISNKISNKTSTEIKDSKTAGAPSTHEITTTPSYDEFTISSTASSTINNDNSPTTGSLVATSLKGTRAIPEMEIEGYSHKEITITLPNVGWIYRSADTDRRNVELLRVDFSKSGTDFIFRFSDTGKYLLNFERQDLIEVNDEERQVLVNIFPKESEDNVAENITEDVPSTGNSLSVAEMLSEQNTSPGLEQLVAQVQSNPSEITPNILMSISDIVSEGSAPATYVDEMVKVLEQVAIHGNNADVMLFMLAQMYEHDTARRGAGIAYKLYNKLTGKYPLSHYYTEALDRMEYISRHFLFIK